MNYKLFWQFSAKSATVFGLNKKDLMDPNKKR